MVCAAQVCVAQVCVAQVLAQDHAAREDEGGDRDLVEVQRDGRPFRHLKAVTEPAAAS
jgi:hypothetical protein